jgi:hypothetical protein
MNGSDDPNNLVDLTAREHFVAHMMWAKVHGGNQWYSVNVMTHGRQGKYYPNSRLFEIARKNAANQKSIDMKTNNPNQMAGVKEKQRKNCSMFNPIHVAKISGENHPRRKNPEKWAHLKGVKRNINMPTGENHPNFGKPQNPKKIKCIDLDLTFESLTKAAIWLKTQGFEKACTPMLTTGVKTGQRRYGFHWQYV